MQADNDQILGFHQCFILKQIGDSWVCTNDMFRLALHNFWLTSALLCWALVKGDDEVWRGLGGVEDGEKREQLIPVSSHFHLINKTQDSRYQLIIQVGFQTTPANRIAALFLQGLGLGQPIKCPSATPLICMMLGDPLIFIYNIYTQAMRKRWLVNSSAQLFSRFYLILICSTVNSVLLAMLSTGFVDPCSDLASALTCVIRCF